jgi:cobalamin synthase
VLRIMRDHAIGAYGAVALILLVAVKAAALAALIGAGHAERTLVVAAALGRWGAVPLGRFLPYARRGEGTDAPRGLGTSLTDFVGPVELVGSTLLAVAVALGVAGVRGAIYLGGAATMTWVIGQLCNERIGGVTGDVMGANTELCEALLYVLAVGLG